MASPWRIPSHQGDEHGPPRAEEAPGGPGELSTGAGDFSGAGPPREKPGEMIKDAA